MRGPPPRRPPRWRRARLKTLPSSEKRTLVGLFLATFLISLAGAIYAPLTPFLRADLGLTEVQIGFLASAGLLGAVVATLPAGAMTEILHPRTSALVSVAAVASMTVGLSLATTFLALFLFLAVKGAVGRLMEPAVAVAVASSFPGRNRGMALAAVDAGAPLGQMTIAAVLPILAISLGWNRAVVIVGVATLMGLPLLSAIMRVQVSERKATPPGRSTSYRFLWDQRDFARLIGGQIAYRMVQGGLLTFIILYLNEARGVPVVLAGMILALIQGSGSVARLLWAWLQDRFFHQRRALFIAFLGLVGALGCGILVVLPHDPPVSLVLTAAILTGASVRGLWPSMVTVATELGEERLGAGRSTSVIMLASALGAILGPPLFGATVSSLGYPTAWAGCVLLMLAMSALVWNIRPVARSPQHSDGT